ncbi:hypothetical protein A1O3_05505 [Capronia epimyces CBS 606.96]|uniref:Uncharacterized protein n=1 Tax=Capronia epimyces CBS 606.96 TaxID=1182542 RepID=W9XWC4_9EURO|nr:uncharacterized protein A1O3_05505 [Capronia epimyces CBS 606.96]EXJ84832.1 hypothetical protein A1O3_05505 [Capronia epimyces CBS 606.96]
MLSLQRSAISADKCTANVLPCRIHHDGPTKVTKRYWSPQGEKDGTQTSHFRGRRLRGRVIQLPDGYQGVVAKSTDRYVPQPANNQSGPTYTAVSDDIEMQDEEDEPPEPVKVLEALSSFDKVVVWGHDHVPTSEDLFVKGLEEWISFAEAIHGKPTFQNKQAPQGPESRTES